MYYDRLGIPARACHPRDILGHVVSIARFEEREPELTRSVLERACRAYFLVMAHDALQVTKEASG
jgi:hypothetical protein